MQTAIAITNDNAGTTDEEAVEAALAVLRGGYDVELVATGSVEELDSALEGRDTVIVIGGDGSLHAVVAALSRLGRLSTVTLGLIPLGTGNDFARALDIPLDPADAAQLIVDGHTIAIDLIHDDNGLTIVNAVHLGVGAESAERAETWKENLGVAGYAIGALLGGFNHQPLDVQVSVDGLALPAGNGVLQVAVNNGTYVGGGTPLSPAADPTDGELDITISYATGPTERVSYANDLRTGVHIDRDDVMTLRGKTVSVRGESFSCSADGEVQEGVQERTWTIEPAALQMFAPKR